MIIDVQPIQSNTRFMGAYSVFEQESEAREAATEDIAVEGTPTDNQ